MSNEVHWVTPRVAEARKRHASVTVAVAVRIERLLKGHLRQRQLPAGELSSIARALIADMDPASPKAETKQ